MADPTVALGVDVGARALHVVALDDAGHVVVRTRLGGERPVDDLVGLATQLDRSDGRKLVVGIDGPAGPSTGAHLDDHTLAPKFRPARGCEVELGRQRGIWVPWVTGPEPLVGWMAVAAAVHEAMTSAGHVPLETYPYGTFVTLLGRRPPRKTTVAGRAARTELLRAAGLDVPVDAATVWTHDDLDAAAAALVALRHVRGDAVAITCALDGTAVWLPA